MRNVLKVAGWLLLAAVSPSFAVTVSAKTSGSVSPISLAATASSSHPITGWTIYVDYKLVYRQNTSSKSITKWLNMSTGTHKVVAKAWDATGASGSASVTVKVISSTNTQSSVSTTGLIPKPPSTAKVFSNIDQMNGWIACSVCANDTPAIYWFKQGISSPSLDGNAMQTYVKGDYKTWADNLFV